MLEQIIAKIKELGFTQNTGGHNINFFKDSSVFRLEVTVIPNGDKFILQIEFYTRGSKITDFDRLNCTITTADEVVPQLKLKGAVLVRETNTRLVRLDKQRQRFLAKIEAIQATTPQ